MQFYLVVMQLIVVADGSLRLGGVFFWSNIQVYILKLNNLNAAGPSNLRLN